MVDIQQSTGLSNNKIRKLGSFLNQISPLCLLEPNFQQKFASAGSSRKDFLIATNAKLPDSNEVRDIVDCINLKTLKENITVSKDLMSLHTVKLGLDGGV